MLKPIDAEPIMQLKKNEVLEDRLKQSCQEFESIFLTYMLESMGPATGGSGFFGENHEGEIIKSMFNENLSRTVAHGSGMGIGYILYEQLKENI